MAKIHCFAGQIPIFLRTDGVFFQVKDLAEMAVKIEKHYGCPMEPGGQGTEPSMMAGSLWGGLIDMAGIHPI